MRVKFIACVDKNFAVGNGGKLLFRIREDMKLFREITMGSIVIMGRKTYEEIGKPLEGRINVVLSRSDISIDGVHVFRSVEMVKVFCESTNNHKKDVFVIGGGEVWNLFRRYVTQIHITKVPDDCKDHDTLFPYDILGAFILSHRNQIGIYEKNSQPVVHEVYDRQKDVLMINRHYSSPLTARFNGIWEYSDGGTTDHDSECDVTLMPNDRVAIKTDIRIYELSMGTLVDVNVLPPMFMDNGLMIAGWDVIDDHLIIYAVVVGKSIVTLKHDCMIADVNIYSKHPLMYVP